MSGIELPILPIREDQGKGLALYRVVAASNLHRPRVSGAEGCRGGRKFQQEFSWI